MSEHSSLKKYQADVQVTFPPAMSDRLEQLTMLTKFSTELTSLMVPQLYCEKISIDLRYTEKTGYYANYTVNLIEMQKDSGFSLEEYQADVLYVWEKIIYSKKAYAMVLNVKHIQ